MKIPFKYCLVIIGIFISFFGLLQFLNAQTKVGYSLTSDYGPREVDGKYDWHNGLDFGTGSEHKILKAIEAGTITLVQGDLNIIRIGNWEYVHCYKNMGTEENVDNPVPKAAAGSNYKVYCGNVKLTYKLKGEERTKQVFSLIVWENEEIKSVFCNQPENSTEYNFKGKTVRYSINEGEPFAITSAYGYNDNYYYGRNSLHLHLQLSGWKNPYTIYQHGTANYIVTIKEPTAKKEISQNKPESQRILVNVNSKTGLDLNKLNLYLFPATKESPAETDLININKSDIKGSFNFAGDVGYPMNNCFPRSMYIKIKEGVDTSVARGSFSRTGVDPNGVGDDDFYYTHLNTKVDQNDSPCDDVLKAKYPDGEYYFFVRAYSILGKTFDQKQQVILNNWTPQIKSFTTNSTPDKPLKAGDTIEIKIEFTEQMDTGKKPKVEIWDAKASQWKALSLDGAAWSNSSDGRIKDALLKASAKLPEWGETGEGTTQEIKVKVTEAYGKGENDVIKKGHSEKDASGKDLKITADLYIPKFNDGSVVPAETNADEPQSVFVGVNLEDNESGFAPGEKVTINIQGVGSTTGQVDADGKVQATFQSPVTEGTYPVTIEIPKDKAGNESKEKKKNVGTLKVTKKPDSDKSANPDESLDVFGPSLTGNQAPRFGPVKVAIFKSGYAVELSDLLATFGEAADYIPPENFSPALAATYPVLIIPSAGLANRTNSVNLREKLTEYVEKGGNLIVMTRLGSEK